MNWDSVSENESENELGDLQNERNKIREAQMKSGKKAGNVQMTMKRTAQHGDRHYTRAEGSKASKREEY